MRITVAVPTIAGRSKYLASALKTCVTQGEDFEILVSDNSPGEARDVVEALRDERVRYVRPPAYLPMSAHWDFVLTEVKGDLLTIIGDDDGLMPGCIGRVKHILEHVGLDLPMHHALGSYCWPDFIDEGARNLVQFFHPVGRGLTAVASSAFLNQVARGRSRYVDGPMVYHNFVPMPILRRLTRDGVFFRRASPDVYSSLAIASSTPRFLHTEELLTISGQGAKANGAAVQSGGGGQFVAEMESLYAPRYRSRTIQMQLLDSLVEVAEYLSKPELLDGVEYGEHVALAIAEVRKMNRAMRHHEMQELLAIARLHSATPQTMLALIRQQLGGIARRLRSATPSPNHAFSQGQMITLHPNVQNVYDASVALAGLIDAAEFNEDSTVRTREALPRAY